MSGLTLWYVMRDGPPHKNVAGRPSDTDTIGPNRSASALWVYSVGLAPGDKVCGPGSRVLNGGRVMASTGSGIQQARPHRGTTSVAAAD